MFALRAASLLSFALFAAAEIAEEKDVLVLTDDNFEEAVNENTNIMVEFYAPWCGHCKSLEPEYAAAAKQLKKKNIDAKLGKVDATVHKKFAEKFEVQGFPTIKFFLKGKEIDASAAGRDKKSIVRYIKKKVGPPAPLLESAEDLTKFAEKAEKMTVVVVGFFADENVELATQLKEIARGEDSIEFRIASHELGGVKEDTITVYRAFGGGNVNYKEGDLKAFISNSAVPTIIEFSQEAGRLISSKDVSVITLSPRNDEEEYKKTIEMLTVSANEIKKDHDCLFVHVDTVEHGRLLEFFGVKAEDLPKVSVLHRDEAAQKMNKFLSPAEGFTFDSAGITAFAKKYFAGELKPHLKKQALPEDWDKEPVKVLTGENFEEIVNDAKRAVFVEFYAPWCGHCKNLAPIWDELATNVGADDLMIAKVDSTENELESVSVQGFPTLKFWPKGADKKIVDYDGGRDLESLTAFIEEQTGKKAEATTDEL